MNDHKSLSFQYYQSANEDDCELIKRNFIVRKKELGLILSNLEKEPMKKSVQHFLILGRRGSGKSTLLKRIECEAEENDKLENKFVVVNLAEEQGSIHRLFDLWEEVIKALRGFGYDDLPDTDLLDIPDDFGEYSRQLYQTIQTSLKKKSKKLLLLIDNIDRIFLSFKNEAQLLREILLNYDDIKIIGGSTEMSEHFWQHSSPFYQFFRIIRLEALSSKEIKKLLMAWAFHMEEKGIKDFIRKNPGQLEAIRILTDGLPRTLRFFIDLLINRPQQNGYAYIKKIMDTVTPLYQERLVSLTSIEQKVVMKLAFSWDAVSIKDLVKPTKTESKLLSAILKKLNDIGIVDKIETGTKNHLYRLSERFFNMWLIVTQGNPVDKRKARWLTVFLENWYNEKDLKSLINQHMNDLEKCDKDPDHLTLMTKAIVQSKYTSLKERDLLIRKNLSISSLSVDLKLSLPLASNEIIERIKLLIKEKKYGLAITETQNIPNEVDGSKYVILGNIYIESNNEPESEKCFLTAIEKGNSRAMFNLALLYESQGKYGLAEKYYLQAIKNGNIDAMVNVALLYEEQKEYKLAEKFYRQAIEKDDSDAMFGLALLYRIQEKYELAEKFYLQAIEKGNSNAMFGLALLYKAQKKYELAEKFYLQAIENGDSDAMFNLALLYDEQKKYELAKKFYLLGTENGDSDAMFNLALLYEDEGEQEQAEKYYLHSSEMKNVKAMNNLGIFYKNQKRYELAETFYLQAIENEDSDAMFNLALLYEDQGKRELAEKYYIYAIDNGISDAMFNLALLYEDQKKYELAEKYYYQAIEKGDSDAMFNLALLYQNQEKYDQSEKYFLQVIEMGDSSAIYGLALLYEEQEKYELAEKYFLQSIDAGFSDAIFSLALLYHDQEKNKLAEKYYLEAINVGDAKAMCNLALLYEDQKKYELAEKYFLQAIAKEESNSVNNLSVLYYLHFKDKCKSIEIIQKYYSSGLINKEPKILIQLWAGNTEGIIEEIWEVARSEDGLEELFILHLLLHYQKNLVWQMFSDPEIGDQLKDQFKPLFYATSILINDKETELNRLKIPPEIEETVNDILIEIERLRTLYYKE